MPSIMPTASKTQSSCIRRLSSSRWVESSTPATRERLLPGLTFSGSPQSSLTRGTTLLCLMPGPGSWRPLSSWQPASSSIYWPTSRLNTLRFSTELAMTLDNRREIIRFAELCKLTVKYLQTLFFHFLNAQEAARKSQGDASRYWPWEPFGSMGLSADACK